VVYAAVLRRLTLDRLARPSRKGIYADLQVVVPRGDVHLCGAACTSVDGLLYFLSRGYYCPYVTDRAFPEAEAVKVLLRSSLLLEPRYEKVTATRTI